ncbi:24598_t:CDS:2, partial [Cetraspora pellucida]
RRLPYSVFLVIQHTKLDVYLSNITALKKRAELGDIILAIRPACKPLQNVQKVQKGFKISVVQLQDSEIEAYTY